MSTVFIAFANNQMAPLPTLREEDEMVHHWLARRKVKGHIEIHRDSFASLDSIAEYLILFKDEIVLFLFSGHAGKDRLILDESPVGAVGIAKLLGQCPKLQTVVLNGCSTAGQVDSLLENGVPSVIATSAPVNDRKATLFSIHFFQSLCEHHVTLLEAFQAGMGAAQMEFSQIQRGVASGRRLVFSDQSSSTNTLWGIYHTEGHSNVLDWRLPTTVGSLSTEKETNEVLIDTLIDALAEFNSEIHKILTDEEDGVSRSLVDKRKAILECMPYPISEHLRKLMVPEKSGSALQFYDRPGGARISQILVTYKVVIELMGFTALAQLWDQLTEKSTTITIDKHHLNILQQFFTIDIERRGVYSFIPIIQTIRQLFEQNEIEFFVSEMHDIAGIFREQSDFYSACMFMEQMRVNDAMKRMESEQLVQLSLIAEEKLAHIFKELGFIVNYALTSVRDIRVIKHRHSIVPKFRHDIVKLVQRFVGLAEEQAVMSEYTDSASILLAKATRDGQNHFLNLSPFIIDVNAFDTKARDISKLYAFSHYDQRVDNYTYTHIYKPNDAPLTIHSQKHFAIIKAQFNAFANLLSNTELQKL